MLLWCGDEAAIHETRPQRTRRPILRLFSKFTRKKKLLEHVDPCEARMRRFMLNDLGITARGRQMTRVVETLKGEGKLVRSMTENIVTYHLEVVEETGIAPTSSGLRTIAGCVSLLYTDLELQPSLEKFTLHLQDGRRLQVFCKRPGWIVATGGIRND